MVKDIYLTLFDLVICLSEAMDLVSSSLTNHHKQVAYIAFALGEEMGLDPGVQKDLVLAGALHDIGALSLSEKLDVLEFEAGDMDHHAVVGSELLSTYEPLAHIAPVILHHHRHWRSDRNTSEVTLASHIVHLADRVSVMINPRQHVLMQSAEIVEKISAQSNQMFSPNVVAAFTSLAKKESFWLNATSAGIFRILRQKVRHITMQLSLDNLDKLALFMSRIIDFRSRFTATHSCGVAATAQAIAGMCGFCKRECDMMRIAGYLHDLGKLAVPAEILEKPAALTREEYAIIRTHTFFTYKVLDTLEGFETIAAWAAFHHERMNGNGYPFHHNADSLSLGSRIMCVADVFTAITEDRPYRPGMNDTEAMRVLDNMVSTGALDKRIVSVLENNVAHVNKVRKIAQQEALEFYSKLFSK